MRPRTDRRRRWKRRWAERRGATENQRRCVRVPRRINVWGYYYPQTFPFSQTLSNRDKHESFLGSFIFPFPNLRFPFSQINKLIFLKKIRHFSKYSSISRSRWQTTYRDTLQNQLSTTSCRHEKSARRRTRSGGPRPARTGAERRHRTFEPWQGSKKRTIPIRYRSFFKRETGIEPATPSLARRCSTAEPLAHIVQVKTCILKV